MHEMNIYGVSFDLVGKQPIVLLKTAEGNKFLPIWIGHAEAAAILMKLQSQPAPRPMTHDLMTDILEQLDAQLVKITVTELRRTPSTPRSRSSGTARKSRSTPVRPMRSRSRSARPRRSMPPSE